MHTATRTGLSALILLAGTAVNAQGIQDHLPLALESAGRALASDITGSGANAIEFSAGEESQQATLKWAYSDPSKVFSLIFSVPADSSGTTDLGTLDGLTDNNKVTVNFKRTLFPPPERRAPDMLDDCRILLESLGETADAGCALNDLISEHRDNPAAYQPLLDLYADAWSDDPIYFWGLTASYGDKAYSYLDPQDLKSFEQRENSWSSSVYLGLVKSRNSLMSIELKREESYEDQGEETLCDISSGESPIKCVTGAIGAPQRKSKNIVSLRYRRSFANLAISPSVNYDDKSGEFGVNVPVFLFKGAGGRFVGGINSGWTDTEHDWSFSLFVGTAFKFF